MDTLRVDGVTTTSGGKFESVKIGGVVTVNGNLEAGRYDIDGIATINGSVIGGDVDIDGVTTINEFVRADRFDCDGTLSINGNVDAQEIDCGGVATIYGNLRVKHANISGVVTVRSGHVEADKVICAGMLTVEGELNAEVVDAEGFIKATEIVGEKVTIRSSTNKIMNLLRKFKGDMGVFNFIEASEVDLRKVKAKTVHGHNVRIGVKCEIDTVDCDGTLYIDSSATVGTVTGNHTLIRE